MPKSSTDKQCFVIAPIGDDGTDTRRRSDQVLKHIIKPAAEICGYHAERADEIDKPGLITSQVIQRVVGDPLVVADLTGMNPNVFYELALRHAIRKPLVQIIEKGERIPFDVAGTRTIHVDHTDLDSAAAARDDIVNQIRALENSPGDVETPVSVSVELQSLRQSENPEDRSLAELLAEISEIRISISKLQEGASQAQNEELARLRLILERAIERGTPFSSFPVRNVERLLMETSQLYTQDHHAPNRAVLFGMLGGILRDRLPWLAEGAMEVYRQISFGTAKGATGAEEQFRRMVSDTFEIGLFRESFLNDKQNIRLYELLRSLI